MNFSIIIPVFNESPENIQEVYARISTVCSECSYNYEIIFVDDGSTNNILTVLKALCIKDNKVKVVSLDRNYGQANAFLAGFHVAKGDFIMTMDADLQYSPEEIPLFVDKISDGYDVVGGKRKNVERSFPSWLLSAYFRNVFGIRMEDQTCSYNMFSQSVAKRIYHNGASICIKHLAYIFARNKVEIAVAYCRRRHGESSYSLRKYLIYGIEYVFMFLKRFEEIKQPHFQIAIVFPEIR